MSRINSLYGSQTSPVELCLQTACLPPELLVSMCPRPHLWICANNTACLASKLQVSMGPDLTFGFVHAKQRGVLTI